MERIPAPLSWSAEQETRLIEMVRTEHTVEEIARELSIPLDEVEKRMRDLALTDDVPDRYS